MCTIKLGFSGSVLMNFKIKKLFNQIIKTMYLSVTLINKNLHFRFIQLMIDMVFIIYRINLKY